MCVRANFLIILVWLVPEFLLDNFQVLLSNIYSHFEMASTALICTVKGNGNGGNGDNL